MNLKYLRVEKEATRNEREKDEKEAVGEKEGKRNLRGRKRTGRCWGLGRENI